MEFETGAGCDSPMKARYRRQFAPHPAPKPGRAWVNSLSSDATLLGMRLSKTKFLANPRKRLIQRGLSGRVNASFNVESLDDHHLESPVDDSD
jgi:hypothetical protein